MTTTSSPVSSPSTKRVLKALERDLSAGSVALFLGAGVDLALNDRARGWESLVADLSDSFVTHSAEHNASTMAKFWTREEWTSLARQWPTETASLMRWLLGDRQFIEDLAERLEGQPRQTDFSEILCQLVLQAGLVVTTNYTPVAKRAIEEFLRRNRDDNRKLRVYDRETLPSLDVIGTANRQSECIIIHLHGRFTPSSAPILDAWGYNILSNDDPVYSQFLHMLFASLNVITVGVSWADVPLRNAAALVRRTRPFVYRHHLALMFHSGQDEAASYGHRTGAVNLWSRAIRATLGVEMVHVDADTQQATLESLVQAASARTARRSRALRQRVNFGELADFLDDCGDYESREQSQWLMDYGRHRYDEPNEAHAIEKALDHLTREILSRLDARRRRRDWEIFTRIERHLRHHLYLYASDLDKAREQRLTLWKSLLAKGSGWWAHLPAALRFDFAVGYYELERPGAIPPELTEFDGDLLAMRLAEVRSGVWGPSGTTGDEAKAMRLFWLGWESLGAKVMGDRLMQLAAERADRARKNAADSAGIMISAGHEVLEEANRAEALARLAGCSRRIVKAVTLGSMWNPDPQQARLRVLGELSAPEALKSLEPGIYRGVAAALLSCDLRARLDRGLTSAEAVRQDARERDQLAEEIDGMLEESGVEWAYRLGAMEPYWLRPMPPHLADIVKKIKDCRPFKAT